MHAIVNRSYGPPSVLELADIDLPKVAPDGLVVAVESAALNPLDWHFTTGTPYLLRLAAGLRRPKQPVRGVDFAGVVAEVGSEVSGFAAGDRVVGFADGAFAQRVAVSASKAVTLPDEITFDDAAALPIAAVTALQGLRDRAKVSAGESVLVIGAGGGVGSYAVQVATAMGARVTGVCSTGKVDLVRSLGAVDVIDYLTDDFAAAGASYDVILDAVGNSPLSACRRALAPTGVYVLIGGPKSGKVLGPIKRMVAAKLRFLIGSRRMSAFTARQSADDLRTIVGMAEQGTLRSVIDRRYPLAETATALDHLAAGHTSGKIIIDVAGSSDPADRA